MKRYTRKAMSSVLQQTLRHGSQHSILQSFTISRVLFDPSHLPRHDIESPVSQTTSHHQLHTDAFIYLQKRRCISLLTSLLWRNLRLLKGKEEHCSRRHRASECLYRGNHPIPLCLTLHLESLPSHPHQGSYQDLYFTAKAHPVQLGIAQA